MSVQNKTTLKSYFETGDRPTQSNFADLIDSGPNITEYAFTTLTDAASIALDAGSLVSKNLYLETSRTAITFSYSNFVDGGILSVKIKKTTASNLVLTMPSTTIGGTTITLIGTANSYFEIVLQARLVTGPSTFEYYPIVSMF